MRTCGAGLLDLKVHRRRLAAALFKLEFNMLALIERAQTRAFNRADVTEHVLATTAALRLNETVALLHIEEFHGACRHCRLLKERAQRACRRATIARPQIRIQRCLQKVPSGACTR